MKNYNPNIYEGMHTVKITLQQWEYKGHIICRIFGNFKRRNILDFFYFECENDFPDNDCQMKYHEDVDCFTYILRDENGNTLRCEGDSREMNDMIVGIEIIDFCEE